MNVVTNEEVKKGVYEIELTARNVDGDEKTIYLPIVVETDEEEKKEEKKEEDEKEPDIIEEKNEVNFIKVGRMTYDGGEFFIEELPKTASTFDTEGFICAGETLGMIIDAKNSEIFLVDIKGDTSIKEFDELTERFTLQEVIDRGRTNINIKDNYDFPIEIYPIKEDGNTQSYIFLYTIPYETEQTLESWATLRAESGSYENIDKDKVFERRAEPYEIIVYSENKEVDQKIFFDVFERWDTILNRDASE